MGAYTRANAEVCLLGVTPGFKAKELVKSHAVHQVIESPIQAHSVKPDEAAAGSLNCWAMCPELNCLHVNAHPDGMRGAMN